MPKLLSMKEISRSKERNCRPSLLIFDPITTHYYQPFLRKTIANHLKHALLHSSFKELIAAEELFGFRFTGRTKAKETLVQQTILCHTLRSKGMQKCFHGIGRHHSNCMQMSPLLRQTLGRESVAELVAFDPTDKPRATSQCR